MTRLARICAGVLAAVALSLSPAAAQNYPDKSIRVIVSIAAGSVTGIITRAVADELVPITRLDRKAAEALVRTANQPKTEYKPQ